MIRVRYRAAPDMPVVSVMIDETKHSVEAVLQRAHERVFPGPVDPKLEAESEARFQTVMAERAKREKETK